MQDVFFHRVNAATVRVLAAEGCDVLVPRDQQCCGALELHAGREDAALARARRDDRRRFEALDVDYVVTNVAGCGSSMKEYGHLLADDPEWAERAQRVQRRGSATCTRCSPSAGRDGPRAPAHPVRARVAYHDACHLGHAQKVRAQPRAVLRSIPGWSWWTCPRPSCAAARPGIYNMVEPDAAGELGARKAANIAVDAGRTSSSPPTRAACCRSASTWPRPRWMGDGRRRARRAGAGSGKSSRCCIPVQLLDASIRGVPIPRT